jgi:hypothetical protein
MKRVTGHCALAFVVLGLMAGPSSAGLVTIIGTDLGAGPNSPRPNSDAAAATFDTAAATLGPVSTITFESAPVGSFHNLTVAPGVMINGTDVSGNEQTINNMPNASLPSLNGFNTTAGGSQFVNMSGGNLVFTFVRPTQFFGAYLTGVQTNFFTDTITFDDGTSQTITVPGNGTSSSIGEVTFIGFTDAGKFITSVTVNAGVPGNPGAGSDNIGVDDVRYQSVPEPTSLAMCVVAGGVAMGFAWGRRRLAGDRQASA